MSRLFVAIDLPEDYKEQLIDLYKMEFLGANWMSDEKLHLTLSFIGEVDGATSEDIKETLSHIKGEPFNFALKGVGHFPPRGEPRILWAGVESGPELLNLQKQIERRLIKIGIPPEKRKFSPHITLARLNKVPSSHIGMFIAEHNLFRTEPFVVKEFTLFSSMLSPKGSHYTKEVSYLLQERSEQG